MYACYDAYVVYGVMEGERNACLESHWLSKHFPSLDTYASDVVRNTMGNAVYGAVATLNGNGTVTVNPKEDEEVKKLFALLSERGSYSIGYFTVVSGDYELDHCMYNPDE